MRYPVYIISKGRWNNNLTTRELTECGVPHYIIVEESEYQNYLDVATDFAEIIILPESYIDEYDTCGDFGDKSKGSGPARNYALDHSKKLGFKRHWLMDDNLEAFYRLHENVIWEVECDSCFSAMEDFVDRYSNVPIAGPNYNAFVKSTEPTPPFRTNTRIYSCLLIDNHAGYRWRGRYNEDTDICLRVLKDGLCTIIFQAFLCGKVATQRMKGGNTEAFYAEEGTKPKSQMIVDLHPDVAKLAWRFNRWHHDVDYKRFKQKPKRVEGLDIPSGVNNYGMHLIDVDMGE